MGKPEIRKACWEAFARKMSRIVIRVDFCGLRLAWTTRSVAIGCCREFESIGSISFIRGGTT